MPSGNTFSNMETSLLSIFRWILIVALFLLIIATGLLFVVGVSKIPYTTQDPEPARTAPNPNVLSSDFLSKLKEVSPDKTPQQAQAQPPLSIALDSAEAAYRSQSERLWVHISKYQSDCGISAALTKSDFIESLRQTPLKRIMELRGTNYAASQDEFVKATLGSEDIIRLCKSGRGGLFFAAIEFHRENWDKQVKAADLFESQEAERIAAFKRKQENIAEDNKATAMKLFMASAIAFGLFMSVALFLVFARIEANLRGTLNVRQVSE